MKDRAAGLQAVINPYPGGVALPSSLFRPLPTEKAAAVRGPDSEENRGGSW